MSQTEVNGAFVWRCFLRDSYKHFVFHLSNNVYFGGLLPTRCPTMNKLLTERTVQAAALDYLENYYRWRARGSRIWSKMEVRTQKQYGGKRADGLLVFRQRLWGNTFVASMEAKSYKTLDAITPRLDVWRWLYNSAYYATLIALGTGAVFFVERIETPQESWLFAVNLWVALLVIVAIFTRHRHFNRVMPVYHQVRQYPGHEQWIATSVDSYEMIPDKLRSSFVKVLKARGIGLLLVDHKRRVQRIHRPKRRRFLLQRRHPLQYYSLAEEIRTQLRR